MMIAVIYTTSSVVKVCEICEIDSLPLENKFNKVKDTCRFRVIRSSGGGRETTLTRHCVRVDQFEICNLV